MKRFIYSIAAIISSFTWSSCTNKQNSATDKSVNLFIWSNYITDDLLNEFHQKTGIKVKVSNFASNEELLAKIQAGASGYDVIVPSDYMISVLIKSKLIKPLDLNLVPNLKKVDPKFLSQSYDPKNTYSVPYGWSTTGIAVNRKLFTEDIKSWKDLLENEKLKGKVSLLDDMREVFGAALKIQGYSLNSQVVSERQKALDYLKAHKSQIKEFNSDPLASLTSGDIWVAQMYSSDALASKYVRKMDVEYILPTEGGTLAIDNLAIPATSEKQDEAHALINFMLEPKTNLSFVKTILAGPILAETKAQLPQELQNDKKLLADEAALSKFEKMQDLGSSGLELDKMWTTLKIAN